MNRDKQIEEMAKDFCALSLPCEECHLYKNRCHAKKYATRAYNAGYRKTSDVVREIFEELLKDITHGLEIARCTRKKFLHSIEKNNIWVYHYDGEIKALEGMECLIAELKKKYTESEDTQ